MPIAKPSGDYIFELEGAGGCPTLEMKYTINNLVGEDDSENITCKDVNIDLVYDSTYHNFGLFVGKEEIDSIYSFKISFDTLHGSVKEFTHHEIHWDWVKHVRYDSTKTVYYFGTDSIIRSFITTIDASGHSFTHWYNDIVFVSCGPLNKQGIWTLIGYKVSEQKYYMYVFDKINLTALPLLIPNENRGQTYTKVWNFGPDEYATKIVSGQYEIVRFASNAYPPFEISLSRPFKIKTISKWNSNQWMVGGDLNGSIVIAGDTIVSEDWTKTIFIWYDWTGTIIKYKVIESEEDRILTHVATDGIERIVFAGFEIDSSYFNNFDSLSVDSCIFGDTISIEGIPQLKQGVFGNFEPEIIFDNPKYAMNDDYVKFYPNPFKAGINLQYESVRDQNIKVILINALGQIVFESDLSVSIGPNELYLKEFEYLPGGLYNAIVKNNATEKVYKLIKIE
ncbi:MAG: T9SS type A sorting domain-containing protein [Saprospiraceae bacterium]|nr:T9SS type A sorting domain-containing protein [Saprospiraceae bacterium]